MRELENVAVVVTRYYGGTNLGVGGLARSYSQAVKDAVDDAGVVEERPHERVRAVVDYDDSGTVRGIVESVGVEFDAEYDERVRIDARVPVADAEGLRDRLRSATSGRVEFAED
jgi:putative IMPACT (imprinted ancient) family translation regulator